MDDKNDNSLGERIHLTSSKIGAFINRKRKDNDLLRLGNEGNLLLYIYEHPSTKAKDLQEKFRLSKATISCSLSNREKKGLLKRDYEGNDKRTKKIRLTDKGKEACLPYRDFFLRLTHTLEENVSREEKETTIKVLNQVLLNLEEEKEGEEDENY